VVELLVLVAIVAVLGLFFAGFSLLLWLVFLPFRILGLVFKGVAALLAIPFILLAGLFGLVLFGLGALAFIVPVIVIPFLPFALIAWGIWWLVRRARSTAKVTA
jgi:hypothetical protein